MIEPISFLIGLAGGGVLTLLGVKLFKAQAQHEAANTFKVAAAEALRANNESFLTLAEQQLRRFQESAKTDLEQRGTAITEMMTPVAKSLEQMDQQLRELEKNRAGAYAGLHQQVSALSETHGALRSETGKLVQALRKPMGRGMWGELQLARLLELAGMEDGIHYESQASVTGNDGRLRPDMVIKLPGNKSIVIDVKTPLDAYLDAIEAQDDDVRQEKLEGHVRQVRTQVRKLSEKSYWQQFDASPEFVVMFIPSEGACSSALQMDPTLIEAAMRDNVVIATPLTLFALLKTIAYGWRQENIAENAANIAKLGHELFDRIATMGDHLGKVGDRLRQSVEAYNSAIGSMESRVMSTARKLKDHNIVSSLAIEPLPIIESTPRSLSVLDRISDTDAA